MGFSAAVAVPTKVSADYGAIIRDIAIKAGVANAPQEKQMSQTILQTSRDSGMGRNEVAQVVNSLVGAGMDLAGALSYAPTAAKFVVGQGAGAEDTAKMINALGQNAKISDPKVMQQALEAIAYQGQAGMHEMGVALIPPFLIQRELAEKRLVVASDRTLSSTKASCKTIAARHWLISSTATRR